jgi:hypothetical protein
VLENFGIQACLPYVELISLDHHSQPSFVGASVYVCLSYARLPCLRTSTSSPHYSSSPTWLSCLWPLPSRCRWSSYSCCDRFVFVLDGRAAPWPRLSLSLPFRSPRPLDWFGIWSMKEFRKFNCNGGDGFEEFFHWPDECRESWGMAWVVTGTSLSFQSLSTTSSYVTSE